MKINLHYESERSITTNADPSDRWDRPSTFTNNHLDNCKLTLRNDFSGVEYIEVSENEFKIGDVAYVVVVEYSTGDSFGHDRNACVEVVGAFHTIEEAVKAENLIISHKNSPLDLGNGYVINYFPWEGYFEIFEEVHIISGVLT